MGELKTEGALGLAISRFKRGGCKVRRGKGE